MTGGGILFVTVASLFAVVAPGAHGDRVLLRDISALTLRNGRSTNYRRSSPVPQLKCVGGTAGCSVFTPQVVQCQNRGFDGYDVQWECKTDMDNAYRFGEVAVSCEGYDYPDDPYVLRGSCGLEYTIDYTKEGHQQANQKQHQYYGDDYHDRSNSYYDGSHYKKSGSGIGSLLFLGGAAFVVYMIYKTCLSGGNAPSTPSAPNPDDPPPYSRHDNQAPPPGFKPEFTSQSGTGFAGGFTGGYPNTGGYPSGGYSNTGGYANTGSYTNTGTGTSTGTGGGFWSGMAAGGLMGYLFGNNRSGYNNYNRHGYTHHRPHGSSWGNSGMFGGNSGMFGGNSGMFGGGSSSRSSGGSFFGGGSSSSSSTGTRTASGFGGTKRR